MSKEGNWPSWRMINKSGPSESGEKRRDRLLILKDSSPVLNQREMITPVIGRVDLFYNLLIFKNDRFGPDRFGP